MASKDPSTGAPSEGFSHTVDRSYLPNLCEAHSVFLVVVVVECLAVILALAKVQPMLGFWIDLSLISMFVLWVTLISVMLLCYLRQRLHNASVWLTTLMASFVVLGVTLLFSLITLLVLNSPALGADEPMANPMQFVLRNLLISALFTLLALRYFYVQHQWRLRTQEEARSRFQALQARIRPHFLFNSLNTIAALIAIKPQAAEDAVLDLSEVFRATLEQRDLIALEDELTLTRKHLGIEALRLGDRLQVEWRLADDLPLQTPVPALLIQPLVENAVYHGIQNLPEGGSIVIDISVAEERWRVCVENPINTGPAVAKRKTGHGFAQNSIEQRLRLAYGDAVEFSVDRSNARYVVRMSWPLEDKS